MKTTFHIVCILAAGVLVGLMLRRPASVPQGPQSGEVIYTNSDPIDVAAGALVDPSLIENPTPTKPPEDEEWLSKFELTERSGETVRSDDLRGQPYIVSFFFSTCPSICVQQNQKIKELQDEFLGKPVRFLAITVDPETDTPERLREYAARYGADEKQWLFLTGQLDYIRRIGAEIFRQPVAKQFHTERFALVDARGEIEGFYNWPERRQMDKLRETINEMIVDLPPQNNSLGTDRSGDQPADGSIDDREQATL